MRLDRRISRLVVLGGLWLAAAAPVARTVVLSQQPGSALEATARQLVASDLRDAATHGDTPVLLVGSAPLASGRGHRGPAALFVQVQSASLCGSAGCSTSIYVGGRHGWKKVLDSISGPIGIDARSHAGMHDLLVHSKDRWVGIGSVYSDTLPAPAVDLRDTTPKHARHPTSATHAATDAP